MAQSVTVFQLVRSVSARLANGPLSSRPKALLLWIFLLAWSAAGLAFYRAASPDIHIVQLELAGSSERAEQVLTAMAPSLPEAVELVGKSISAKWVLIITYVVAIAVFASIGYVIFVSDFSRLVSLIAVVAAPVAGALDVIENLLLKFGLRISGGEVLAQEALIKAASGAAALKFSILFLSMWVAISVALVLPRRMIHTKRRRSVTTARDEVLLPWPTVDRKGRRWPAVSSAIAGEMAISPERPTARQRYGRTMPSLDTAPPGREPAEIAFCVSGGGIRSGTFALGVLQSLRPALLKARYLISVSGGGYIVGAMQQALQPFRQPDAPHTAIPNATRAEQGLTTSEATPEDVFGRGSMEEDHSRRHGSFLADGFGQWVVALWEVLRGILASFVIIVTTVVCAGLLISHFYSAVPLVERGALKERLNTAESAAGSQEASPAPAPGARRPRLLDDPVGGNRHHAVLVRFALLCRCPPRGFKRAHLVFQSLANALLVVDLLLFVLVIAFPVLMWAGVVVTEWAADRSGSKVALGGQAGAGAILLTYLGALTALVGGKGKGPLQRLIGMFKGSGSAEAGAAKKVPKKLMQRLVVGAVLMALLALDLILFGLVALTGYAWEVAYQGLFVGILLVFWICVDQTWMSLHTFYRRRLGTAFAVRRVGLPGGDVGAQPYDFKAESTKLSAYAAPVPGFPQVIFSCAANVTGANRTPSGRRATSFSMSYDYVGGPDFGWVPTPTLESIVSGPIAADLTVQAAVAISGAAFAAAMGTQSEAAETLLALSNARLGSWLPNPVYLHSLAAADAPWWMPALPRIRRISYFYREVFKQLPEDNRLLLVTDGGHYDNLGLVETLRHRSRLIFAVDASADSPPFARTLTQAITQAKVELGVTIRFDGEELARLIPGSVTGEVPEPLKGLWSRLAQDAVAIAEIEYPQPFVAGDETEASALGYLVFAKARLTPDLPPELLAHAQSVPIFPADATSDQWFSYDKFNAYQGLGNHVGSKVVAAARARDLWPEDGGET